MSQSETAIGEFTTSRVDDLLEAVLENREMLSVFTYLLVILFTSALLAPMLGRVWQSRGLSYLLVTIPVELGLLSLPELSVLLLGLWWGLVLLLVFFDTKKRLQGVLLVAGTVVTTLGLCQIGLVCGNLNLFANLDWLTVGIASGLILGGIRDLPNLLEEGRTEFRDAAQWVFYLGSVVVVVGFFETHIRVPLDFSGGTVLLGGVGDFGLAQVSGRNILLDAVLTSTFVVTLGRFIEYDAETDLFVLGPTSSGKTMFILGAYYQATEAAEAGHDPIPNQGLYSQLGEVDNMITQMNPPEDVWWPVTGNEPGDHPTHGFDFVHGTAFPKNVRVRTIDYAGEWLELVPDIVNMDDDELEEYFGDVSSTGESDDAVGIGDEQYDLEVMRDLRDGVNDADVLVLIIDVEKLVAGKDLQIDTYNSIVERYPNKTILLVATKCDLLAGQFERTTGLDHLHYFDDFRQYVEETLNRREQVRTIVNRASRSTVHPVWFQTRPHDQEGDERVPVLTEYDKLVPVGFDRLLTHFGRGR